MHNPDKIDLLGPLTSFAFASVIPIAQFSFSTLAGHTNTSSLRLSSDRSRTHSGIYQLYVIFVVVAQLKR